MELDRRLEIRSGKIRIEKEVVDNEGNRVEDVDKFFNFKVNVDGALNGGSDVIRVRAKCSSTFKSLLLDGRIWNTNIFCTRNSRRRI